MTLDHPLFPKAACVWIAVVLFPLVCPRWATALNLGEQCGGLSGGRPVPATRAEMGPDEFLWPRNAAGQFTFRPAANLTGIPFPIPNDRDSTIYRANGGQIPNAEFGLELFNDVARIDGNDDWLFVAYNVGLQVWDLRFDPANPLKVAYRDGWLGHFHDFPTSTKVETYVESIDVIQSDPGEIWVGLAGRNGHGFSFWEFLPPSTLVQHCQFSEIVARQVELVEYGGRSYAFVAANDGTYVFDLSSSLGGGSCALEGKLGTGVDSGNYISLIQQDDRLLVAVADGNLILAAPLALNLFEVNPESPTEARLLFSGFDTNTRGLALFSLPGPTERYFLGLVEDSKALRIYSIDACLAQPGPGPCGTLGPPIASQDIQDINKLYEFFDISTSADGRTWGYYGFMTSPGLFGTKFEYLLDLTPLATIDLAEVAATGAVQLSEITDGGQTYPNSSPCAAAEVDYWGDYYPSNSHGLSFFTPRHAIFIGDKLYRAGYTLLDVHEILFTTDIFSDGFESGGLLGWSSSQGRR